MNIIFISHSSLNNSEARAVCDWLQEQGWDEVFLDLDPERGIAAGERWESALHRAASRCDAVLFLVSRQWLESEWCRREFHLAQKLNKRCFILLIEDIAIADLPEELTVCWQVVNLAAGTDHGQAREVHLPGSSGPGYVYFSRSALTRLKTGLVKAGLEPKFFAWPPEHDPRRSPYRGLRPLDMADAGIFFGREAPMIDLMARLRGLHGSAPPRFLAILGASGAGKSSFLRAGILPRLSRDERYFYPLPVIRPEQAVLSGNYGLAEALYQACQAKKVPQSRQHIKTMISGGIPALGPLLHELVQAAAVPDLKGTGQHLPQPVLAVDQGEELFMAEGREESCRFLSLLQGLLAEDAPPLMVLFTIRSDSYGYLQSSPELEGMPQQTFSLPPLPAGAYQKIIEEPAKALDGTDRPLALDPKLTQQLLLDAGRSGARDALPLLAFTLGRLYEEYAGDGALRLEEYRDMGGIEGAIQKAVDNALKDARANPALPDKEEECLTLLRRGLIPWMAGIDPETSLPRRRVARLDEVPEEARAVIRHFVEHRLLATDTNDRGEVIIEPAHEALLRQWVTLRGWLAEDTAALSALETLKAATRDWEANDREAGWLTHQAGRLEDAEALQARKGLAGFLTDSDKDYLGACRKQENQLRNRELQQARDLAAARKRTMQRSIAGLAAALVLLVIASGLGILANIKSKEAMEQKQEAIAARDEADTQRQEVEKKFLQSQIEKYHEFRKFGKALDAWAPLLEVRSKLQGYNESLREVDLALSAIVRSNPPPLRTMTVTGARTLALMPDHRRVLVGTKDGTLALWDMETGRQEKVLGNHDTAIRVIRVWGPGNRAVSADAAGGIKIWDLVKGELMRTFNDHQAGVTDLAISPGGGQILSADTSGEVLFWNLYTGEMIRRQSRGAGTGSAVSLFSEGDTTLALIGTDAQTFEQIDLERVSNRNPFDPSAAHTGPITGLSFYHDIYALSASEDGTIKLWELLSGDCVRTFSGHAGPVAALVPLSDSRFLTGSADKSLRIWDLDTGKCLRTIYGHRERIAGLDASPDGKHIVSLGTDGKIKFWYSGTANGYDIYAGHIGDVTAVAASGTKAATGDRDGHINVWDPGSGSTVTEMPSQASPIAALALSSDGSMLLSASMDGGIHCWHTETGRRLHSLAPPDGFGKCVFLGFTGPRQVCLADDRGTLHYWDLEKQQILTGHSFRWYRADLQAAAISPDGSHAFLADSEGVIYHWDLKENRKVKLFQNHPGGICALAILQQGKLLASASFDGGIRLWSVEKGRLLEAFSFSEGRVLSLCGLNDSELLVAGGNGRVFQKPLSNMDAWLQVEGMKIYEGLTKEGSDDAWFALTNLHRPRMVSAATQHPPVPAPGKSHYITDLDLLFLPVAAGTFVMGDHKFNGGNEGLIDNNGAHKVILSQGFWVSRYEIRQRDFAAFANATGYKTDAETDIDDGTVVLYNGQWQYRSGYHWRNSLAGKERPVCGVSWHDAQAFCNWLTDREAKAGRLLPGHSYRLPTEAEWEYAARAGTRGDFDGRIENVAWFDLNADETSHGVGLKKANTWGLYDVHGNVWEWCLDSCHWKDNNYVQTDTYIEGITDPLSTSGSQRVLRGGSWYDTAIHCRSARRLSYTPAIRGTFTGLRPVLAPSP
ncbi:nSTAND1 domain-containing NTPase [Desulfotignum balticum]|uniref:nSTAND1 domain-containing NTPase n=1 Tax=Desulfotignum balticum TaxID=115781 RepID=UPI000408F9A5|nr:SUMF1/EgtB/PvdO family nonheme iron enzyme [Desulfotignum balticum]